ncbi:MAG: tetratricopeptide repeat protein, partial [Candidatus Binatia bacterium]
DETPEARLRTRDIFVASLSSRFTRIIMLAAGMLVIVTVLTVLYLSLPISSTQHPVQSSQPALPLPDKPSIVVLPFTNMSEDPKQEYFSDGITTAITSSLSRIASLFVIARTSAFMYKEKSVKVQDISREMGVRYVLEGSVQKADQHVRITVQLIDATTGYHLWAEHYDRPLKDIFALQDEIVQKIVTTLKLQLAVVEQSWVMPRHTSNLEAYDAFLRGADQLWRVTPETNAQARQLFEKAIDLDSQYAEAYALLGWVYLLEWNHRWSQDRQNLERAAVLAQQAITLDPSLPVARWLLSACYLQKQQYDQALAESERAITLDRNNSGSYAFQAEVLNFLGRPEEAIQRMEQAMRLEPYHYPANYLWRLGWAYLLAGHYAEAIAAAKEALNRNSNEPAAFIILASSYLRQWGGQQGEDDQTLIQALAAAQRVRSFPATIAVGHRLVGYVYVFQKQYEQALTEMEQALTLAPEDAGSYASLAEVLGRIGRTEEALPMVEEALRRKSPVVADHLLSVGAVYLLAGKPAEAIVPLKQYLIHYPHMLGAQLALAAAYSELGQTDAAARAVAEALRINPQFSLEVHKERMPIEDPATVERVIAALRKAGLK